MTMTTPMTPSQLDLAARLATQLRGLDPLQHPGRPRAPHLLSVGRRPDGRADARAPALRLAPARPAANDHLIFSKGHASPLLYSMFRAAGVVDENELIKTYRQLGARLQGHPTPVLPRVDVATGSLGQGLPDAVGVGLAGKYLDKLPYHVWVLCGDSETAEGSRRRGDALQFARHPVGGGVESLSGLGF
jgi:transketolase